MKSSNRIKRIQIHIKKINYLKCIKIMIGGHIIKQNGMFSYTKINENVI